MRRGDRRALGGAGVRADQLVVRRRCRHHRGPGAVDSRRALGRAAAGSSRMPRWSRPSASARSSSTARTRRGRTSRTTCRCWPRSRSSAPTPPRTCGADRTWWMWALPTAVVVPVVALAPRAGDLAQAALAAAAVLLTILRARAYPRLRRPITLALALLATGAAVGTLSRAGWTWCDPSSPWQGHGVWHVLAATALVVMAPTVGRGGDLPPSCRERAIGSEVTVTDRSADRRNRPCPASRSPARPPVRPAPTPAASSPPGSSPARCSWCPAPCRRSPATASTCVATPSASSPRETWAGCRSSRSSPPASA